VPELGKLLVIAGIALALVGGLLWLAPQIPWLGRLPGDLRIERPGVRLYLPIATSLALSVLLTLILNCVARWR
jgi:hypothetical protein